MFRSKPVYVMVDNTHIPAGNLASLKRGMFSTKVGTHGWCLSRNHNFTFSFLACNITYTDSRPTERTYHSNTPIHNKLTRGKCGSRIKGVFLNFQHKWMFLSTMQTLPFEGHNVAYQCIGLDQSNNVCEYEWKGYNWKTKL